MGKDGTETGRGRGVAGKRETKPKAGVDAARNDGGKRGFYILLAIVLIGGIASLSYMASRPKQSVSLVDTPIRRIPNQGHAIGSDSAPVEVIEFADFECPACGIFATLTEPDVRTGLVNTGQVRFRFMDFPLSMHRNTWPAHRAAWCAGEQSKFWEMHDAIFFNRDRWNGEATSNPDKPLAELARPLGLDMAQFEACVKSRKYDGQIQANVDDAKRLQISSTPTFIIGNTKVAMAIPYDEFKRHVDSALAQARSATKPR
jgi:protein-disulfide isomerase